MKQLLVFCTAAILALPALGQKGYRITGNVEGLENGKVYLSAVTAPGAPQKIDSAEVVNGQFTLSGKVQIPLVANIATEDNKPIVKQFFIENSEIAVDGSLTGDVKVTGSAEQALYEDFLAKRKEITDRNEQLTFTKEFIVSNPKSSAAGYLLSTLTTRMDYTEINKLIAGFDPALANNLIQLKVAKEYADKLERTSPGKKFIDFALPDTTGKVVALSDVAGKGKYVLLDFWASWCGPCRAENPHVVEAYKQFGDKGFTVFGVSLDRPGQADRWKAAIVKDGLIWTNVSDLKFWQCEPAVAYGVRSIPSNLLLGPDGTIVAKNLRGQALTDKLKELLGE